MRTNSIDATAFRSLIEYRTLMEIYEGLYNKDRGDAFVNHYADLLNDCETLQDVRELHRKKIQWVKTKINKKIDENNGIKENVIIDEPPRENIKLKIAKPRNIND